MKILHVETGKQLYGGALQVRYLLRGLHARGEQNVLVCSEQSAIGVDAEVQEVTERIHVVPMSGDLDAAFVWRLRRIIREEAPDLIHLHSRRGADLWGGIAGRLERVPVVLSRRVDNPEPRWWVAVKYQLYHRVITISEGIRRVLLSEGVPPPKVVCVPSAVDTELYVPRCDRAWFEKEMGLAPGQPVVGVVAQLISRKGHRYLLEAIPGILRQVPEVQFLFFGSGALAKPLEDEVYQRGLSGNVRLVGFRDDLARILPCLDVVAHPATMEGLGVALLQSSACGVPLVASAVGGIPEIVKEGVNGYLVSPRNPSELERALLALLQNRDRARMMGMAGRAFVERNFSIEAMVEGNRKVYAEVLSV